MKGLTPLELDILDDAQVVFTPEEIAFVEATGSEDDQMDPTDQAATDRLKARGLVVEDGLGYLDITPRGRLALLCHYAASFMKDSNGK